MRLSSLGGKTRQLMFNHQLATRKLTPTSSRLSHPLPRIHSSLRSEWKRRMTGTNLSGESTASSGLRISRSHNPVAQSSG
ncbi:hypothetical protein AArcCO_4039 (plasmid) [Halalkaliarchaeum sp. AArc-CO]|nr:hypothetical protein AArcCO_4039 [Halalkaliarchaeum sp. AArc-CO]